MALSIQVGTPEALLRRHPSQASNMAKGTADMAKTGMATNIKAPPKTAQGLTLRQAPGNKAGKKADEAWRRLKNITQPDTNENKIPAPNTHNST